MPLPADYLVVQPGFYLSQQALDAIEEVGPPSKWYDAKLIPEAVANHLQVYRGLRRKEFHDAACYSSLPKWRHDSHGNRQPPIPGRVFLVFTVLREYGEVVFDWEWRPGNERTGHPHNWEENFGGLRDGRPA